MPNDRFHFVRRIHNCPPIIGTFMFYAFIIVCLLRTVFLPSIIVRSLSFLFFTYFFPFGCPESCVYLQSARQRVLISPSDCVSSYFHSRRLEIEWEVPKDFSSRVLRSWQWTFDAMELGTTEVAKKVNGSECSFESEKVFWQLLEMIRKWDVQLTVKSCLELWKMLGTLWAVLVA